MTFDDSDPSRRHRTVSWTDIEIVKAHATKEDYLQGWAEGRYPALPFSELS